MGLLIFITSLLPDYRVLLQLILPSSTERKTGATTFSSTKNRRRKYSLQEELPISQTKMLEVCTIDLMEMGAKLVVKTLDGLAENSITEQPQPQVAEPKKCV